MTSVAFTDLAAPPTFALIPLATYLLPKVALFSIIGRSRSRTFSSGIILALATTSACAFLSPLPPAHLGTAASTAPNGLHQQQQLRMSSTTLNDRPSAKQRAVIVGGGPAGALMAVYLSRSRGFEVDVFEAFEESKISGPTVRSWNVVLFERGSHALESAGVDLKEEVGVFFGRDVFTQDGGLSI